MIVPFPPGGQADLAARPVAAALEKSLAARSVDNRSGAGGMLGNAAAARAEPDGHTLLMALSSMTFLPEAERIIRPQAVLRISTSSCRSRACWPIPACCACAATRPGSRWRSRRRRQKAPGQISFSSSGNYGAAHVPFEMFQQAAGIKLLHVPYRGGGPAHTAFLGKQVEYHGAGAGPDHAACASRHRAADRELGSQALRRNPDVPTLIELGYKDVEYYIWAGLFTPKGTPAVIINRLRDAMREAMKNPQVTDVFVKAAARRPTWTSRSSTPS